MIEINKKITLSENRCYICGVHWALESQWSGKCPRCARDEIRKAEEKILSLKRSNASLRGALSRRRK